MMAERLRRMLLYDLAAIGGLFEPAFINKMVSEHIDGRRDWHPRLWAFRF
jgi:hypothetical protein